MAETIGKSLNNQCVCRWDLLHTSEIASVTWKKDDRVYFLPELERPFLGCLQDQDFTVVQRLLQCVQDIVWIRSADLMSSQTPLQHMVTGFARTIASENVGIFFATVTLECHDNHLAWADMIVRIMKHLDSTPRERRETEYTERDGMMTISRVAEARGLDQEIHAKSDLTLRKAKIQSGPPLTLAVSNPGFLDSLLFVEDTGHETDLGPDEIEIEVKSVGINFRDLMVALGKINAESIGIECAGLVTRIGANCNTITPGDRVCAIVIGCMKTLARGNSLLAVKIPDSLSYTQAASLPIAGSTAYSSLVTLANLKPEEFVLIHSAAGGTGQMAIQVAQSIGAEVFVTVGSKKKMNLLKDLYRIPIDHIFYSRDSSFAEKIIMSTCGRGVDVALNSLAGDGLVETFKCMAPFGRFVELGKADIYNNSKLPMLPFSENVSFYAVALDLVATQRPALLRKSLLAVMECVLEGRMRTPCPLQEMPVSDIESALRAMQSGQNSGKMVLNFDSSEIVPVSIRQT